MKYITQQDLHCSLVEQYSFLKMPDYIIHINLMKAINKHCAPKFSPRYYMYYKSKTNTMKKLSITLSFGAYYK